MSLDSLRSRYDQFADDIRMNDQVREVNDMHTTIRDLPAAIAEIRSRSYVFRSFLERKAEVMEKNWTSIRHRVDRAIHQESEKLQEDFDEVERAFKQAERLPEAESRLERLENGMERLQTQVEAAQERVRGIYQNLRSDVSQIERQLRDINWICDQKDEASFEFLAGENLFLAAKGEWVATGKGKNDPDGILFLTDQRLIFEQKEKEGKRLGMFGGKQVQEAEWTIPLHQIESVEAEKKGMLGGIDLLHFTLGSGAPYPRITVEVKGGEDCKFWVKQIQRMISGDVDDERSIEPDPELIEQLRSAPTECHVCGGKVPMLVAGQNQIECEYCGTVIRI
jgi:archaellum component FlaC